MRICIIIYAHFRALSTKTLRTAPQTRIMKSTRSMRMSSVQPKERMLGSGKDRWCLCLLKSAHTVYLFQSVE